MEKAIITAASNKYFPSLINLLGSIKLNYPNHPKIFVYDLGLFWTFRKELEQTKNVEVLNMPHFCTFWRACYTWKTYIFAHPLAKINLYLDAGNQILEPLDEIFAYIDKNGYFLVGGLGSNLDSITPKDYKLLFNINEKYYTEKYLTAGILGFKNESIIIASLIKLYNFGKKGMCLGFSPSDKWRNKGKDKVNIYRDCLLFRHDTTLLNLILRQDLGDFVYSLGGNESFPKALSNGPNQIDWERYIWNLRLGFLSLSYIKSKHLHARFNIYANINRIYIGLFLWARLINLFFKGKLFNIVRGKKIKPAKQSLK